MPDRQRVWCRSGRPACQISNVYGVAVDGQRVVVYVCMVLRWTAGASYCTRVWRGNGLPEYHVWRRSGRPARRSIHKDGVVGGNQHDKVYARMALQ